MSMFNPPHPGLVLREYLGKSPVSTPPEHLGVSRVTPSRVLNGRPGVSADLALRLADALGTSPELWAGMQSQYDLWVASVSYTHLRAHETDSYLVCRLL